MCIFMCVYIIVDFGMDIGGVHMANGKGLQRCLLASKSTT